MVATSVPPLHAPSGSWLFDYDYDEVGGVMTHLWKAEDAFNGIDGYCKFCNKILCTCKLTLCLATGNVADNGKGKGYENVVSGVAFVYCD